MNAKAWIAAAAVTLSACNPEAITDPPPAGEVRDSSALGAAARIPLVERATWDSLSRASDPYLLESAVVEGDSLIVVVRMGGGCSEHVFTPYIRNMIYLSSPPGIDLLIHHASNRDQCLALIGKRLAFDLELFRPAYPGGFIYLNRDPDSSGALRIILPQATGP